MANTELHQPSRLLAHDSDAGDGEAVAASAVQAKV